MKKLFLFFTAIFILISGCKDELDTGTGYSIGFVTEYFTPERMRCTQYSRGDILVSIEGRAYISPGKKSKDKSGEYMQRAIKYGDTGYKQEVMPGEGSALTVEPEGIRVVCDTDIDTEHPAGSPLDDIILMYGWTYTEYIESGYKSYTSEVKDSHGYDYSRHGSKGHTPFFKFLKDIGHDDLVLMRSKFWLYLPPDLWPAGEYNLTVTLFGDEFELSQTVTCVVQ